MTTWRAPLLGLAWPGGWPRRLTRRLLAETDSRLDAARLDELLRRASRQEDELEDLRVKTAGRLLDER